MPTYEYHCHSCNKDYEVFFKNYPSKRQVSRLKCETKDCPGPLERKLSTFNTINNSAPEAQAYTHIHVIPITVHVLSADNAAERPATPYGRLHAHNLN